MKRLALSLIAAITLFNAAGAQSVKQPVKKELTPEQSLRLQSVRNVEQWVMGMRDDKILATSLAQIADLAWKTDEEYSRALMNYALNRIALGTNDPPKDVSSKNAVRRRVVMLIAKHDTAWAKMLIESYTKDSHKKSIDSSLTAQDMIESDPKAAAELVDQSILNELNQSQVYILKRLRVQSPDEADRLFQKMLALAFQHPDIDANIYAGLGVYLFRDARQEPGDNGTTIANVGGIGMPVVTGNIPGIPPILIQNYLRGTILIINHPSPNDEQRKVKYALGHVMIPKAREFAPNLEAEIVGAMATLSAQVPAEFTSGDAYKYLTKIPGEPEDRAKEIEANPDPAVRDQLYLDMAMNALRKNNFESAKFWCPKIEEESLKSEVESVIQFAEVRQLLKAKNPDLIAAWRMTNKLPESIDKAMLWLALAAASEKAKDRAATIEDLGLAHDTAVRMDNETSPFLLMYIAGQSKIVGDMQSSMILGEALKAFNKFDNIQDPDLVRPIGLKQIGMRFNIDVPDVKIGFQDSFFKAISGDADNAVYAVNDIKDERLRGLAYVGLTKILLERKLPSLAAGDEANLIAEDVLRRSATKTVMPLYPAASLRKKIAGTAVAELQYNAKGDVTDVKVIVSPDTVIAGAVEDALKQWKFTPAPTGANQPAPRGRVTFSFVIDKAGKGDVKNPVPAK